MEGIVRADSGTMQSNQNTAAPPMSPSRAFLIRRLKALGAEPPPASRDVASPTSAPTPAPTPAHRRATVTGLPPQTGTFTVLRLA